METEYFDINKFYTYKGDKIFLFPMVQGGKLSDNKKDFKINHNKTRHIEEVTGFLGIEYTIQDRVFCIINNIQSEKEFNNSSEI